MRDPVLQRAPEVDVFIAGAGPVGLFLANECARLGMSYHIVEANATQSEHSKALAIFPRTFEIFDMAGLAEPFSAAERFTDVLELRTYAGSDLLLLRPDGYAASETRASDSRALPAVEEVLGRQVR